jgi:predicted O-methyltransferase YrrM
MSNVVPNPEAYFHQLIPSRDALLRELEAEAEREKIPIVGPFVGQLLLILVRAVGARKILELGTATGYSAIYLARGSKDVKGRIVTIEQDAGLAARARQNFQAAGVGDRVEIRVEDALTCINNLSEDYDFIFLDIEKKDYSRALPALERLMRSGGLLIADNVAFADADSFNQAISRSPMWQAVPIFGYLPRHSPEHDGLYIALKS